MIRTLSSTSRQRRRRTSEQSDDGPEGVSMAVPKTFLRHAGPDPASRKLLKCMYSEPGQE
jgi:hypothetical protein